MRKIEIGENSWHYRFLLFMFGKYNIQYMNFDTCSYISKFVRGVLKLLFLSALTFGVAYAITFSIIVTGIYINALGFGGWWGVDMEFNNWVDIIAYGIAGLMAAFAAFITAAFLLFIAANAIESACKFIWRKITGKDVYGDRIRPESSATQIVKAWQEKICVPVVIQRATKKLESEVGDDLQ